jgi:hypothetical protein
MNDDIHVRHIVLEHRDDMAQAKAVLANQMDITGADTVQVSHSSNGSVIWVNVNGLCLLRICRIRHLEFGDVHVR